MQSFLRGRPEKFKSLEHAIEWSLKANQIRNLESAKVSMVGQLKRQVKSGQNTRPTYSYCQFLLLAIV